MKISCRIFLLCVVLCSLFNVLTMAVATARTAPRKVFTFESISGLGSCRSQLSIRAEHKDRTGITVWLSVIGSPLTTCNLTINQGVNTFENYSLSGVNFQAAHRFNRRIPLTSNSLVIPKQFILSGKIFAIRLAFLKPNRDLVSPLITDAGQSGSCASLVSQIRVSEMQARRCSKDSDCSLETIPFGCGCHHEKPLNKVADTEAFYLAVARATKAGCSIEEVSSCECRKVSDIICRMGVCDWR
jgi:hypothetical protein